MNPAEPATEDTPVPGVPAVSAQASPPTVRIPPWSLWLLGAVASAGLVISISLWQKLSGIQEQLARQSADTGTQAIEARTMARQAQDLSRETAARLAVTETRLSEVSLQRSQLEELMQSLSRSRDENLVVDIESAMRLAQQQAQLTGSVEPLLAALRTADQRIARAAQPRLARLRTAITQDLDRIKAANVADLPGVLNRLDELVRLVDELPVANAVGVPAPGAVRKGAAAAPAPTWWAQALHALSDEVRGLVRVSRIEQPDAALLSPEQSFFLRENLKLKLLNARLGLLARQTDSARADMAAASAALSRYFDPAARRTQVVAGLLQQVQAQLKVIDLPRVDATLAALATAAAGR